MEESPLNLGLICHQQEKERSSPRINAARPVIRAICRKGSIWFCMDRALSC